MYEHFTDGENTGAPLVPRIDDDTERKQFSEHEEAVLSHRIET